MPAAPPERTDVPLLILRLSPCHALDLSRSRSLKKEREDNTQANTSSQPRNQNHENYLWTPRSVYRLLNHSPFCFSSSSLLPSLAWRALQGNMKFQICVRMRACETSRSFLRTSFSLCTTMATSRTPTRTISRLLSGLLRFLRSGSNRSFLRRHVSVELSIGFP